MLDYIQGNAEAFIAGLVLGTFSKLVLLAWRATLGFWIMEMAGDFIRDIWREKTRDFGMYEYTKWHDLKDKWVEYVKTGKYTRPRLSFLIQDKIRKVKN